MLCLTNARASITGKNRFLSCSMVINFSVLNDSFCNLFVALTTLSVAQFILSNVVGQCLTDNYTTFPRSISQIK